MRETVRAAVLAGQGNIIEETANELDRQIAKWGVQDHEATLWFLILLEEVGEAAEGILPETVALLGLNAIAATLVRDAIALGMQAKQFIEGARVDRINGATHAPDVGKETVQVAAVAIAMEENRRRRLVDAQVEAEAAVVW